MANLTWIRKPKPEGSLEVYEAQFVSGSRTIKLDIKHANAYGGNWHGRLRVIVDGKTVLTKKPYQAPNLIKAKAMLVAAVDELLQNAV